MLFTCVILCHLEYLCGVCLVSFYKCFKGAKHVPTSLHLNVFLINSFKATRAQFGHKNGKKLKCPKNLNNCMINHLKHLLVLMNIVHKSDYFPIHHLNGGKFIVLSMGQKMGFPQFSCICNVLSMLS